MSDAHTSSSDGNPELKARAETNFEGVEVSGPLGWQSAMAGVAVSDALLTPPWLPPPDGMALEPALEWAAAVAKIR